MYSDFNKSDLKKKPKKNSNCLTVNSTFRREGNMEFAIGLKNSMSSLGGNALQVT